MRTAVVFVAWAAFMLAVLLWPTSVEGTPAEPVACWSTDDPAPSWRACAYRQRRNHVAASRVVRRLRSRPARTLQSAYVVPEPWRSLAECESGGRWDYNGPSGFDGGLQFHPGTWSAYRPPGYPPYAYQATPEQQVTVARRVLAAQGWQAWPACSARLGLR